MTATVRRLNHAVLYVRDARRAAAFYTEAFGFEVVAEAGNGAAVFMRAAGTENHHDLGLFSLGPQAPYPSRAASVCTTSPGRSRRSTTSPRCASVSCAWVRSSARATTA